MLRVVQQALYPNREQKAEETPADAPTEASEPEVTSESSDASSEQPEPTETKVAAPGEPATIDGPPDDA